MSQPIKCPVCSKPIYFPKFGDGSEEFLESICLRCQYKYGLSLTEVVSFSSKVEALHTNKSSQHPSYKRIYDLRLRAKNGRAVGKCGTARLNKV